MLKELWLWTKRFGTWTHKMVMSNSSLCPTAAIPQFLRKFLFCSTGSPNNPSPVLNLSKSGGGSHGEVSGSEGVHSGPEDEEEDDNLTDVDDEDDKDQG